MAGGKPRRHHRRSYQHSIPVPVGVLSPDFNPPMAKGLAIAVVVAISNAAYRFETHSEKRKRISGAELAAVAGLSHATTERVTRWLRGDGWINVDVGKGRQGNLYTFTAKMAPELLSPQGEGDVPSDRGNTSLRQREQNPQTEGATNEASSTSSRTPSTTSREDRGSPYGDGPRSADAARGGPSPGNTGMSEGELKDWERQFSEDAPGNDKRIRFVRDGMIHYSDGSVEAKPTAEGDDHGPR